MDAIGELAKTLRADVVRGDGAVPIRIVHDSREIVEGDLFVALHGGRVDGHAFLHDAFARGACGALVSDPSAAPDSARNLIVVDDTLDALQRLASARRQCLDATIVGITGSNGKTTTRAMLAHLLGRLGEEGSVFSVPRNYNTEVGLPLALLAMPDSATIGLFELGAERPGDIALLADLLAPDVGLITSIGPSHLDGFRSLGAVANEKWALVESLPGDGLAILNADAPALHERATAAPCRALTVGLEHGAIRGRVGRAVPTVRLSIDDPPIELDCPILGVHHATNLLLAAVAALQLGAAPDEIRERARTFEPVRHRLQPIEAPFGTILDDSYNANPASTAAALRVLAVLGEEPTRRTFVFGEMRDLGPDSDRYHREALDLALDLGIDAIHPIGERAIAACQPKTASAIRIIPRDQLPAHLRAPRPAGTDHILLVKGSRALALERLVEQLRV